MPPAPRPDARQRLPRDARRTLLLDAALAAFAEGGYHATAMDDIAERAGVSKPVLYQHFDSKLDLYLAIARGVGEEVVSTVGSALASTDREPDRIAACVSSFFELVDRPHSGYRLLFVSDMVREPAAAALLEDTRRACGEAIGRLLVEETGQAWDDCVLVGIALAGMAQAAALHWFDNRDHVSRQRAIEVVVGLVWQGLEAIPRDGGSSSRPDGG